MLQRAIAWAVRKALGLAVLAPVLLLVPAAMLDVGKDSGVRLSLFPLALSAFDPFLWTCLWNGVVLASVVTLGAVVIGVRLGRMLSRTRFWTRPLLGFLAFAPAAVA